MWSDNKHNNDENNNENNENRNQHQKMKNLNMMIKKCGKQRNTRRKRVYMTLKS